MRTDGLKKLEPQELDEEDDDAEAPISHQCVDCRAHSPPTRTQHTLISAKHGWRLIRVAGSDGSHRFEWRCPKCWASYKAHQATG
jgi:hypothetical protein